jgi:hypothetical protein
MEKRLPRFHRRPKDPGVNDRLDASAVSTLVDDDKKPTETTQQRKNEISPTEQQQQRQWQQQTAVYDGNSNDNNNGRTMEWLRRHYDGDPLGLAIELQARRRASEQRQHRCGGCDNGGSTNGGINKISNGNMDSISFKPDGKVHSSVSSSGSSTGSNSNSNSGDSSNMPNQCSMESDNSRDNNGSNDTKGSNALWVQWQQLQEQWQQLPGFELRRKYSGTGSSSNGNSQGGSTAHNQPSMESSDDNESNDTNGSNAMWLQWQQLQEQWQQLPGFEL